MNLSREAPGFSASCSRKTDGAGEDQRQHTDHQVPSNATASQRARRPSIKPQLRGEHVDQFEHQQPGQQAGQQLQGQCQQQPAENDDPGWPG
jgi:hypothetical protein